MKSPQEIEQMRLAGRMVHEALRRCTEACQPGATTREVDAAAISVLEENPDAVPLFKDYPGPTPAAPAFPAVTCISVNDEVVHGIPGDRVVREGDLVSVDFGVRLNGWCGDSATTILVGDVSPQKRRLCEVTQHVLQIAIDQIRPGRMWSSIAQRMEDYAVRSKMGVIRDFVGHGIGRELHEEPKVPNFCSRDLKRNDLELVPGMVLAVEPMCTLGGERVAVQGDHWTVKTVDGKFAAHYEHTIAVTEDGCDILTDGS
ncbi:MAG: type I methionyl aminopeptidase [Planctomycetota bacterium]